MGGNGWESENNTPWNVCLKTLKRDLMEAMELTPNKLKALVK
jgi:hypothetical protein